MRPRLVCCQVLREVKATYRAVCEGIINLADKFFEMERADALRGARRQLGQLGGLGCGACLEGRHHACAGCWMEVVGPGVTGEAHGMVVWGGLV